jgi:hypothetical protein
MYISVLFPILLSSGDRPFIQLILVSLETNPEKHFVVNEYYLCSVADEEAQGSEVMDSLNSSKGADTCQGNVSQEFFL